LKNHFWANHATSGHQNRRLSRRWGRRAEAQLKFLKSWT